MTKYGDPNKCARCGGDIESRANANRVFCHPCGLIRSKESMQRSRERRKQRISEGIKIAPRKPEHLHPRQPIAALSQRCAQSAVRAGIIPPITNETLCADCGGIATEYDHRDYSRPFDVEPVCRSCNLLRGWATDTPSCFFKKAA